MNEEWKVSFLLNTEELFRKINFPQFYIVYLHNKEGKKFSVPAGVDSSRARKKKFSVFWLWLFNFVTWKATTCTCGKEAWWIIAEIFFTHILVSNAQKQDVQPAQHTRICDDMCRGEWNCCSHTSGMNEQNLIAALGGKRDGKSLKNLSSSRGTSFTFKTSN